MLGKVPLKYNLRSLWVRRAGTLMTAVGIGLTVAVVLTMAALVNGLVQTFVSTGNSEDIIVLRKGSNFSESNSYFNRDMFQTLRFLPEVARDEEKDPIAVGEVVVVIAHPRLTGETANVVLRGTTDQGFAMRPELSIVEGRMFREGVRELMASTSLSNRFQDMRVGDKLRIASNDWNVVGLFDAGQTAYGSELWGHYDDIAQAWQRPILSSVTLRSAPGQAEQLIETVKTDDRLQMDAHRQTDYYAAQSISAAGITALGVFIAVVMGVGSCFAAMNMMFSAIMSRFKEIGTLRALGFKRRSILLSFFIEALLLALLGGICGILLAVPIQTWAWMSGPMGSMNFMTFSEVTFNFRITPFIMMLGMVFSLVVGTVGGIIPAFRASRIRLIEVLRD